MINVPEMFGSMAFNEKVMRARLPKDTYTALKRAMREGKDIDINVANVVANAMKDWAIEKGVTHFTHWFQPMTGITAEKHDSFIVPLNEGGVIMEFSGKELIKGEPDASSFPSGGLRATFEARGYTAWDPSSPAFIKDNVLCIPCAFCSYGGEVLDKKTPLLRSTELIRHEALRILRAFGDTLSNHVDVTVGPEQEYFLIDKDLFKKRADLLICGRTLFGAKPPKGQELDDHYFGAIKPRVTEFMEDLDRELWKIGVLAKTKHNEAAPSQHELAPIFTTVNIAADHNQVTMELMKKVARRHGFACLLHEKPFAGINGSGKHNNWSLSTDRGENLLSPGKSPYDNTRFLTFLAAIIKAVDEHQDLLRLSVATAGNDHRLGSNEAPPAIVSVFIGSDLEEVLNAIENDMPYTSLGDKTMATGVHVIPDFIMDNTDRNRTSPFAFTGNKFEFRMLGSSISISDPNIVLNTIVADVLSDFADVLEKADDTELAARQLVKDVIKNHKRIIFSGNNYAEEWTKEAEARGLLNLKTTADAIPHFESPENIELFTKHGIFTEVEIHSRCEIFLESYCKTLNIEALTMIDMAKKDILPAAFAYTKELAQAISFKKSAVPCATFASEEKIVCALSGLTDSLYGKIEALEETMINAKEYSDDVKARACYFRDHVILAMNELRAVADEIEVMTAAKYWPFPTYAELLF